MMNLRLLLSAGLTNVGLDKTRSETSVMGPLWVRIYLDEEEPIESIKEAITQAVDAWYSQVISPGFIPEDINPYM